MARADKKGRRASGPPFVALYFYIVESPAWLALTADQRAVLIQIAKRYRGLNNGTLGASVRDLAAECNMANATVTKAIRKLIEFGFLERVQEGSFAWKVPHATEFRLTWHKCDKTGHKPTKLFMRWQAPVPESS